MDEAKRIKIGNTTAIWSFTIGTGVLICYWITGNVDVAHLGFFYTLLAGFVNLSVLLWIHYQTPIDTSSNQDLKKCKCLMLSNIPIVVIYFLIANVLMSHMRITFVNETNSVISNIRLRGCEEKFISDLRPNESVTKWVLIEDHCHIEINYVQNGNELKEEVISYAFGPMGIRCTYRIGVDDVLF